MKYISEISTKESKYKYQFLVVNQNNIYMFKYALCDTGSDEVKTIGVEELQRILEKEFVYGCSIMNSKTSLFETEIWIRCYRPEWVELERYIKRREMLQDVPVSGKIYHVRPSYASDSLYFDPSIVATPIDRVDLPVSVAEFLIYCADSSNFNEDLTEIRIPIFLLGWQIYEIDRKALKLLSKLRLVG